MKPTNYEGNGYVVSLKRCEMPSVWSGARKISTVNYNLTYLKVPILSQLLASQLTKVELKKVHVG